MVTPAEILSESLAKARTANRIDGHKNSYAKDNPFEYVAVLAYLDGGARPADVVSDMGLHLVLEEDARRMLLEPAPEPEPLPGVPLPTHRILVPADNTAYWLAHKSATTQVIIDPQDEGVVNRFRQRCIVWSTAGGQSSALYSGRKMFSLTGFRLVTGNPGVLDNLHTQPNDQPYKWAPLCKQGGTGHADSPVRIEYFDERGLLVNVESDAGSCNGSGRKVHPIFTQAEIEERRGEWVWLWRELGIGRSDEGPGNGYLKMWVAGEDDTPRVNATNLQTHWWGQHQAAYLLGCYWSGGRTPNIVMEVAATRFGRTPQECYEDAPVFASGGPATQTGSGGGGTHTMIAPRLSTEAEIPAPLRW